MFDLTSRLPDKTLSDPVESFDSNLAVLSQLVAGEHQTAADQIARGAPSAGEFVAFLRRHGLDFYLSNQLQISPIREVIPQDEVHRLEQFRRAQSGRQEALVTELESISKLMGAEGIEFILLKGPYLAQRFYADIDRRFFGDLDVLIKPQDLHRADKLLKAAGYSCRSSILINQSLVRRFTHGFDYKRGALRLDLHWSLGSHVSYRIDYDAVWRGCQTYRIEQTTCAVLSDEYTLLFHLLSYFEDLARGAGRLKTAMDIWVILKILEPQVDWAAFLAARKEEGIEPICRTMLILCLDLLHSERKFPLIEQALNSPAPSSPASVAERYSLLEARRGSLRSKSWAATVYDCPRIVSMAWWVVSLPFRVMVYDPSQLARMVGLKTAGKRT